MRVIGLLFVFILLLNCEDNQSKKKKTKQQINSNIEYKIEAKDTLQKGNEEYPVLNGLVEAMDFFLEYDKHHKEKIPGVELILTRLHAGGKVNKDHSQYSGGLHGFGVSGGNAFAVTADVCVRRWRREYQQHMSRTH